jgi:hypothetical protein
MLIRVKILMKKKERRMFAFEFESALIQMEKQSQLS